MRLHYYSLLLSYDVKLKDKSIYSLRPLRPPFLLVESVGIGVTSSASERKLSKLKSWHHAISTHPA